MSGKATVDAMDLLHGLMADSMTDELRRGMERAREPKLIQEGEGDEARMVRNPAYEPLSPKLLAVIRAFLKDNGIDAPASSPRFNGLVDELRNLKVDEQDSAWAN